MSSERISQAMGRIDAALARIETQAALARHTGGGRSTAPAELVERHEALRESVDASLAELDALIQRLER
jgi:t-SNARE complex subunit (syntaxin)